MKFAPTINVNGYLREISSLIKLRSIRFGSSRIVIYRYTYIYYIIIIAEKAFPKY